MTQTVPHNDCTRHLAKTNVRYYLLPTGSLRTTKFFLVICWFTLSLSGMAQTYTTKADGAWSSAATWVGGVAPSNTITAGMVINIKHDVTFDINKDLTITGTLNVVGDTLRFDPKNSGNTLVNTGGLLNVKNGGYIQDVSKHSNNLTMTGGRVVFDNSTIMISKGFDGTKGAVRFIRNSNVQIGQDFSASGTSTQIVKDTIQNSTIDLAISENGDFTLTQYGQLWVANATVKVENNNNFKNAATSSISVLPTAVNNYGFTYLKITKDLQNDAAWDARIDASCVGGTIKGTQMADIDFTRAQDCSASPFIGNAPELAFSNPVLKSGTANKQGAIYRFAGVVGGVDAEIKLKKFSRPDIVMQDVDLAGSGWDKAFQPQFGLPGAVQPYQNWYIDFELKFYKAGTTTQVYLPKVDMTALDVDGDGNSISEYAAFQAPSNIIYSTISNLTNVAASSLGQTFICPTDNISSVLIACATCGGDGKTGTWNYTDCTVCNATGLVYKSCGHAFDGINASLLEGPVTNFSNIDTAATSVMATYQYVDVNTINFRYGAKSGAKVSNGSGIRLNSVWFRQFNLTPGFFTLPVTITNFSAVLNNKNVDVAWQVANQKVAHYLLQRSVDGKTFASIATVFPAEETNAYSYTDKNVQSITGALYYRLVSVDQTGEVQYSEIKVVRLGETSQQSLTLATYPNPAKDNFRLKLPASWQGKPVVLTFYAANGTIAKSLQFGSVNQVESIEIGSLTKGMYLLSATCGNQTAQQRIIIN